VLAKCGQGRKVDVHVRFARSRDAIYLDMCDDQWRAIEVTADGWRVVEPFQTDSFFESVSIQRRQSWPNR